MAYGQSAVSPLQAVVSRLMTNQQRPTPPPMRSNIPPAVAAMGGGLPAATAATRMTPPAQVAPPPAIRAPMNNAIVQNYPARGGFKRPGGLVGFGNMPRMLPTQ